MKFKVVPNENCPRCGGGSEFGNRPKVGHEDGTWSWRCYNPECSLGYWNPDTGETEDEPSPEEAERMRAEIEEWASKITFGPAIHHPNGIVEYKVEESS